MSFLLRSQLKLLAGGKSKVQIGVLPQESEKPGVQASGQLLAQPLLVNQPDSATKLTNLQEHNFQERVTAASLAALAEKLQKQAFAGEIIPSERYLNEQLKDDKTVSTGKKSGSELNQKAKALKFDTLSGLSFPLNRFSSPQHKQLAESQAVKDLLMPWTNAWLFNNNDEYSREGEGTKSVKNLIALQSSRTMLSTEFVTIGAEHFDNGNPGASVRAGGIDFPEGHGLLITPLVKDDSESKSADDETLTETKLVAPKSLSRVILFCHGNGDKLSEAKGFHEKNGPLSCPSFLYEIAAKTHSAVLMIEYPGYGSMAGKIDASTGEKADVNPHPDACFRAAKAGYRFLASSQAGLGVNPENIVVMGQSIGGTFAQKLVAELEVQQKPYDSLVLVDSLAAFFEARCGGSAIIAGEGKARFVVRGLFGAANCFSSSFQEVVRNVNMPQMWRKFHEARRARSSDDGSATGQTGQSDRYQITKPVLYLVGSKDTTCPASIGWDLFTELRRAHLYKDGGVRYIVDADKESETLDHNDGALSGKFAKKICEFFEEVK